MFVSQKVILLLNKKSWNNLFLRFNYFMESPLRSFCTLKVVLIYQHIFKCDNKNKKQSKNYMCLSKKFICAAIFLLICLSRVYLLCQALFCYRDSLLRNKKNLQLCGSYILIKYSQNLPFCLLWSMCFFFFSFGDKKCKSLFWGKAIDYYKITIGRNHLRKK